MQESDGGLGEYPDVAQLTMGIWCMTGWHLKSITYWTSLLYKLKIIHSAMHRPNEYSKMGPDKSVHPCNLHHTPESVSPSWLIPVTHSSFRGNHCSE